MRSKLIMACLALTAFAAFALPMAASASPELTHPTGTTMPANKGCPESCILATQVGVGKLKDTHGNTLIECSVGTMTGELTKNTGTEIEGKITSASFTGTGGVHDGRNECTGGGGATVTPVVSALAPWCLKTINAPNDEWTLGKCGGEKIKFILEGTIPGTCEYESTAHIVGTYTTDTGVGEDAVLTASPIVHPNTQPGEATTNGFSKIAGGGLCPPSGTLETKFTLETDTTASADPLYIS
jgi:hypothetical protein